MTVHNRGPEPATLHVLPTIWFRNVWSWGGKAPRPALRQAPTSATGGVIAVSHPELGERLFYAEGAAALLFTENETNTERLFNAPNRTPYVKDGIDRYIVHGRQDAVNPEKTGTKASAHYPLTVGAGASRTLRLRLCAVAPVASAPTTPGPFGSDFDAVMRARRQEADEFYAAVIPASLNADAANVMRQAGRAIPRARQGRRDHGSGAGAAWPERRGGSQPHALTCASRSIRATPASG